MLRLSLALSLLPLFTLGCAHAGPILTGPTVELALDSGHPEERPLTPAKPFELLMRMDPAMPAYLPRRLRLLLAQPGHLVLTLYATTPEGQPGAPLLTLDRHYDAAFTSTGKDGKWIVERLALPVERAPIWVGLSSPGDDGGDVRLWASSNDSGSVFARDPDPATPLSAGKQPRTPMVRLEVSPAP
ncbi:MAG TPA: hypothetical protein VII38_01710 [Polyangia bacterium]